MWYISGIHATPLGRIFCPRESYRVIFSTCEVSTGCGRWGENETKQWRLGEVERLAVRRAWLFPVVKAKNFLEKWKVGEVVGSRCVSHLCAVGRALCKGQLRGVHLRKAATVWSFSSYIWFENGVANGLVR